MGHDFKAAPARAGLISRRRLLGLCLGLPLLLAWAPASADSSARIHLILSDGSAAYAQVAEAFRAALKTGHGVRTMMLEELGVGALAALDREGLLLVPVGVRAAKAVAEFYGGKASVLALLVPRTAFASLPWTAGTDSKVSAVYIDQPLSRSLHLIRDILPRADRIGVMVSPENATIAEELRKAAGQRKLDLQLEVVRESGEFARALPPLLAKSDVLLLIPDARLINENSARVILLEAYRRRVPVVGFSRGLVTAGVVASVYSAPEQIGTEGAALADEWVPSSGALPPPRFPSQFSLAFNPQVARSLGMVLPKEEELRRHLQEMPNGH